MRIRGVAAVAAASMVAVTSALAVTVNDDGPGARAGARGAMMSSQTQDRRQDQGQDARGWSKRAGMAGMAGMMQGVRVGSEYDYLVEMVAHHEEAVAAAEELQRSDRPDMRELGGSIVSSQSAQIEQMQGWLADWYPARSGQADYHPMMRDLSGLSDDRLDRAFLQDMTTHHMAAVMMSHQLLVRGLAEHQEVEELARTIASDQHAEMVQMQQWLQQWFGQGWQHWHNRWDGQWDEPSDGQVDDGWGAMMGPRMMG